MARIGVIGSGKVGQVLSAGLKKHGHEVRIGSRTPAKLAAFAESSGIQAGTFAEVAAWAEGLVLAVLGAGAEEALRSAGAGNLSGKMIIDTTNPISREPPEDGVLRYFTAANTSLMELLQDAFPDAHLVKAFNSVGSGLMVNPVLAAKPTMFYCGNDAGAKRQAAAIIEELGWEPADMGTAVAARPIEGLCQLWCIPGFRENRWSHAFHLLQA
jgi:8-hydroxy-5-deazaflavin:NADPH oxidoreductase